MSKVALRLTLSPFAASKPHSRLEFSSGVDSMKRVLMATMLVIASFMIVRAQADEQDPPAVALTEQQVAALAEIEKAERAYSGTRYSAARRHAERAFELDPANRTSLLIIAQSIHALYRKDDKSPANLVRAREAIAAYQRVSTDPDNDEAFNAVEELYGAVDEFDLQYSWVMQRATSSDLPTAKRVQAYAELALLDLKSSKKISEETAERNYSELTDTVIVDDLDNTTRNEIDRGHEIAARGLRMAKEAITLDPDNDIARTREVLLLQNTARLFELEGEDSRGEQFRREARDVAARYSEQKIKRQEAALARMVTVDCDALCDRVISTPKPPYPPIAKVARAFGLVVVNIEIDENGKVISATAFSGHPLLRAAAVQAARLSTFSKTQPSGQPVKVYGSLIYNFTLP